MILLGSTGSIGVNALNIAQQFNLSVDTLVAGRNIDLLNQQILKHSPKRVVVMDQDDCSRVNHPDVRSGEAAILDAIEESASQHVVNALVGFAGFRPTLKALECGKRIALANKESLVVGGAFVDTSSVVPIDSEHFGLWYLNQGSRKIDRMMITASGGAFRDWPLEQLSAATLADALKHPNWSMGQKITIDSASMVNKLFELLEARWLFGEGKYDAVIETKSLIHAMIDYADGSTTAHFAHADMRLPIAYALMGHVDTPIVDRIDLTRVGALEFRPIESVRYPIWQIKEDLLRNPARGVIVNAANEAAIERFVAGDIRFIDISTMILRAYETFSTAPESIDAIFDLDHEVRAFVRGIQC
ncbi:1-deoxy-D-xylulose-5-phosphate reductoisomerase [Sulfuricurvum sp. RIFCSPLOWO2_12_FULL_43_24]|uniref:1-deoxy-D-xylulose-5-phosphate reductoisomerase n=1 Tax=Sulfuricurvum sp. RIFCSPLOWO2_12_FULL_43_24 TaxID=1802247 RepID=UPI0008C86635|nr:1-deoxy-D-xylulose-5-phosphate reductoisomerase [Sulfuricurvum sp. RIFCSPLOWO2_12_FULL_43_24]OHD88956.1 MAG: 1-deoxy-D-xylulose-5-phosphate reductoisomerase [Sulfuricurvum sp. RIFCSPLOWO2_12_FULL_43_24]